MCGFKRLINNSNFFFEGITSEPVYSVRHSFFSDVIPDEMLLQITMVSQYKNGKLYQIKCDFMRISPGDMNLGLTGFHSVIFMSRIIALPYIVYRKRI
jgi:hypothetical protein